MKTPLIFLMVLICAFAAVGQDTSTPDTNSSTETGNQQSTTDKRRRFEIGAQFTSLMREGDGDRNGFGGRIGYDFATFNGGKYVATVEAEVNFLPGRRFIGFSNIDPDSRRSGRVLQGLFGAKIGRRFDKYGVFAKARPGFVQYSDGKQNYSGTISTLSFRADSETNAALDVGGVLEFYPTRRITTRFDLGDTIVRFGSRTTSGFGTIVTSQPETFSLPQETKHNLQFSAGIGLKF